MSTLYEIYALPQGKRCIRVLEILPANPRLSEPEIQRRDTLNPILHIERPINATDNPPHAPLRFRLKVIDLDASPDFAALSYVWGLPTASPPSITYGNTTIDVTENCYSALVHLRKAIGGFTIWVDAICINQAQENNEEKEAQLRLMGEIYSHARTVYIWLGEGTPATDRAMRYLDRGGLSRYCGTDKNGRTVTRPWAATWAILRCHLSHDKHPVLFKSKRSGINATAEDVEELLSQRWIERLWTYQEILLAENPVVVCGECHSPWENFERGIMLLINTYFCAQVASAHAWKSISHSREQLRAQSKHYPSSDFTLEQYARFLRRVGKRHQVLEATFAILSLGSVLFSAMFGMGFQGQAQRHEKIPHWMPLFFIIVAMVFALSLPVTLIFVFSGRIRSTRNRIWVRSPVEDLTSCLYTRNASEPKDMAFGVWAVLQKKAMDDPLPEITYANDIGHIYWALATQLIRRTASVQLLYLAAAKGIPGAPSWVPDWSARNGHVWRTVISSLNQTDIYGRQFGFGSRDITSYRERDVSGYFEFDTSGKILTVRGRHVCDIRRLTYLDFQETSDTFQESEQHIHYENLRLILRAASKRVNIKSQAYLKVTGMNNQFPLTLLGRAGKFRPDPWFKEREEQILLWTQFCRRHAGDSPSRVLGLLRGEDDPLNQSILATQIMACNLLAREARPCFESAQASSNTGMLRLKGICGRDAAVGDQVVRIMGVPQLLVLRKIASDENAVRIVSPASMEYGLPKGPSWARTLRLARRDKTIQYRIH